MGITWGTYARHLGSCHPHARAACLFRLQVTLPPSLALTPVTPASVYVWEGCVVVSVYALVFTPDCPSLAEIGIVAAHCFL